VLDDTILAGNYVTANKATFLSAAPTELDHELRRIGGRLIVTRAGPHPAADLHAPRQLPVLRANYPSPIVNHLHGARRFRAARARG
jgi:deoxyribodipyrimidine photolyase